MSFPDTSLLLACLGWAGALGTITAYALVSTRRLPPDSRIFQGINAVGAGMLALSAAAAQSWPSTAVNVVWAMIGLQAVIAASTWRRAQSHGQSDTCACGSASARPRNRRPEDTSRDDDLGLRPAVRPTSRPRDVAPQLVTEPALTPMRLRAHQPGTCGKEETARVLVAVGSTAAGGYDQGLNPRPT